MMSEICSCVIPFTPFKFNCCCCCCCCWHSDDSRVIFVSQLRLDKCHSSDEPGIRENPHQLPFPFQHTRHISHQTMHAVQLLCGVLLITHVCASFSQLKDQGTVQLQSVTGIVYDCCSIVIIIAVIVVFQFTHLAGYVQQQSAFRNKDVYVRGHEKVVVGKGSGYADTHVSKVLKRLEENKQLVSVCERMNVW